MGVKLNPELEGISEYMRDFGISILGRAVYEATFAEILRPFSHAISVTPAAHGAEIIIKARIAQEHPLLIFDRLPKSANTEDLLGIDELLEHGKTILYPDLLERLWAATGFRLDKGPAFIEFGKLRNRIVHFAPPPTQEFSDATLRFVFEVVDPLIETFWGDTVANYVEIWDDVIIADGYLQEQLDRIEIQLTSNARIFLKGQRYNPD